MDRLRGKVAVITGGSSGIGAATARLFLMEGAYVVIADLVDLSDRELKAVITDHPDRVTFAKTDVGRERDVEAAIKKAVSSWGRLDVTMACAGILGTGGDVDTSAENWDLVMGVNARGTFFVTKYAVPEMLKAGGGSIINLSSIWGVRGAPGYAAYCASKGAVRNFTKVTAVEHATQNIRANSLHPGVIDTPGLRGLISASSNPQATRAALTAAQPAGQFGKAEDVAWAAVFLASDESRFVSGCELSVDCALLAR